MFFDIENPDGSIAYRLDGAPVAQAGGDLVDRIEAALEDEFDDHFEVVARSRPIDPELPEADQQLSPRRLATAYEVLEYLRDDFVPEANVGYRRRLNDAHDVLQSIEQQNLDFTVRGGEEGDA